MKTNEDYLALGDKTYTPDFIRSIHEQAEQGKIPVSGAGYRGYFAGDYYDNIWTDMSEIVRPTRDGIHGREHISTSVTMGRMVSDLCGMKFDREGNLKSLIPLNREIPIPIIFGEMPIFPGNTALSSLALAASKLTTYLSIPADQVSDELKEYSSHLLIRLKPEELEKHRKILEWATIIEFVPGGDPVEGMSKVRDINPNMLTIINVPVSKDVEKKILHLAQKGAETVHLSADIHGLGEFNLNLLDTLHKSHTLLVEEGLRDRITLLASGGIAAAEHVPKTIIMGADIIKVDVPLLIAMDTVRWNQNKNGDRVPSPNEIEELDPRWGASRVINLMLSWRDQLLEILGAMGLRDVRRLRGETGRAIFADRAYTNFSERLKILPEIEPSSKIKYPEKQDVGFLSNITAKNVPDRFASKPGAWRIVVDRSRCTNCCLCVETCKYDVHRRIEGKISLEEPIHSRCIGISCKNNNWCCVPLCPWNALEIEKDPVDTVLGDPRWTPDLLRETWRIARSGSVTQLKPEEQIGLSGGGFDIMRLATSIKGLQPAEGPINLSIPLNRRKIGPKVRLSLPIYGGGMSYGSISLNVMKGRAMAAEKIGTLTCTGEGGYPDELIPYANHIITQVATGLFGIREETILRAPMVEFKYAQGAKP
ncbi:MAG: glutamate synthase-related protein, partial [Candidatus Aminicenantes bacterium]|nr:glutamate synthase-related protein [Candidatus Aminicenantes bacterium]